MSHIDVGALLKHQPLFQQLSERQILALVSHTHEVRGAKGQMIFQRGDPCEGLFVVVYGRVKLAIPSQQGAEKVVEIIHPGQSFAEAVMFLGRPYPVFAQFLEDGMLLKIRAEGILGAIDSDTGFARSLLAGLSLRLHGMLRDVERYSLENAQQRVIGYLLQYVGDTPGELGAVVELDIHKNLIASRLNLTPETFSRVLQQLGKAGLLRVEGKTITIPNTAALAGWGGE
ncbi:Crp/Fnr family transcriptional regulator [Paludibacterium paludis]|uniref:Regulatory protein n=1 Tax=Paludibacterium paludis TaxID=1225769 RepID=A0A918UBH7_9NEIS|nr:Crp/Fnr family transcriptional regulator [Paludibacterium paludis]GGY25273.1 regulatory protein [Paludibacterium paludis]